MSEKQKLIQEMLEMQKMFIARERADGINQEEYYAPKEGDDLVGYQAKYTELANRLAQLAHEEKGSKR
jgi:hypothetical protein